eukprot:scaffold304452_cov33-Tisochrysis_lutea.AAC.4
MAKDCDDVCTWPTSFEYGHSTSDLKHPLTPASQQSRETEKLLDKNDKLRLFSKLWTLCSWRGALSRRGPARRIASFARSRPFPSSCSHIPPYRFPPSHAVCIKPKLATRVIDLRADTKGTNNKGVVFAYFVQLCMRVAHRRPAIWAQMHMALKER